MLAPEAPIVLSTFGSRARHGYRMDVHRWRCGLSQEVNRDVDDQHRSYKSDEHDSEARHRNSSARFALKCASYFATTPDRAHRGRGPLVRRLLAVGAGHRVGRPLCWGRDAMRLSAKLRIGV